MKKEKFVNLLARRGLSIAALADKSGVSRPTLYKYVHGKGKPRLDTAAKLARVLDVPPTVSMFDWREARQKKRAAKGGKKKESSQVYHAKGRRSK